MVFIGGIRSGKSQLAERRFKRALKGRPARPVYLATVDSRLARRDAAMQQRVKEHQLRRPAAWRCIEVGRDLAAQGRHKAMLLDGLGLWVSLRLKDEPGLVIAEADAFLKSAQGSLAVVVLDESGLGGVGASAAARRFADLNGRINQRFCAAAHKVWRVDAGIATRIK
jgi:adenosylcobinamide kinase/adenosylcobinamide-phosphate guanylyltransferase